MSLDYPNRDTWLAKRATPRLSLGRYVHISKPLMHVPDGNGRIQTLLGRGNTRNVGNNVRKRARRAARFS